MWFDEASQNVLSSALFLVGMNETHCKKMATSLKTIETLSCEQIICVLLVCIPLTELNFSVDLKNGIHFCFSMTSSPPPPQKKYYLELIIHNKYTECPYSVHPFLLTIFKRESALSHAGLSYLE